MKKLILLVVLISFSGVLVAQTGNVGIGISSPIARLHVADSNVVFTGSNNADPNTPFAPPLQGPGARMMWYPAKAAFRAGLAFGNQWDKDSIGILSIALGNSTKAKGESSFASGAGSNASGYRSTAMGEGTTASGNVAFAAGSGAIASGAFSVALGGISTASGDYSFVSGTGNVSSGFSSVAFGQTSAATSNTAIAMGVDARATAFSSVAIGQSVRASGQNSFAVGRNSNAAGNLSTAFGYQTKTLSDYSTVLGAYNDTLETPNTYDPQPDDRIFQLGNGIANNARKNAITILRNGNMGMGNTNPLAHLQMTGGNVVFTGDIWNLPNPAGNPPVEGSGSRFLWYADKAALRAGAVSTLDWNKDSIGKYSFAVGLDVKAKGNYSSAIGVSNISVGDFSFTAGVSNTASALAAIAMGNYTRSRNSASVAIGNDLVVKTVNGFVVGSNNDTSDVQPAIGSSQPTDRLFQIGNGAGATRSNAITLLRNGNMGLGNLMPDVPLSFANITGSKIALYSSGTSNQYGLGVQSGLLQLYSDGAGSDIAFGFGGSAAFTEKVRIKGNGNVGIGNNNPTRPLSFPASLGEKILLYPGGVGETGIGVYGNELRLHADNPAAKVSFGTQDNAGNFSENALAQRNGIYAFSVLGSLWVNGTTYSSDARFKQNITPISSPLQKLMLLNGVEYEMKVSEFPKNHFQPGRQMGLLAQNVEKVVPEAVNELDGYKGVDYARLVPLLIESIKEQQKQQDDLKKEIIELKKLISSNKN